MSVWTKVTLCAGSSSLTKRKSSTKLALYIPNNYANSYSNDIFNPHSLPQYI